ncbi:MAG: YfbU family protein [Bacteroidetes bacterium]|nr:YfbU family protein [Bacteroidota bacterium]
MQLTRTERWILYNQYHIIGLLSEDQAAHCEKAKEILGCGYEADYQELCQEIYTDAHTLTTEECSEVINILAMFDALKLSYEALEDKSGINKSRIEFSGFDGNNETKQMAYTRFICTSDPPRFTRLSRGDDYNSHLPVLSQYRAMLRQWQPIQNKHLLTKDDILRIISAQ